MTKKQQAIKKAYEDAGYDWDEVKHSISEHDGTMYNRLDHSDMKYIYYPKSIEGIEHNNSWISIEDDGLPKEPGNYWFWDKEHDQVITRVYPSDFEFLPLKVVAWFTHYQPVVQPKPPVY